MKGKTLGIGLHRTGTSTLHRCFEILGLRSVHYFPNRVYSRPADIPVDGDVTWTFFDQFDAFTDFPTPWLFPKILTKYPGSKCIFTVRNIDEWVESVRWLFGVSHRNWGAWDHAVHQKMYGITGSEFDEAAIRTCNQVHHAFVEDQFKHYPEQLLTLDVTQMSDWGRLCEFLNKPSPATQIPWLHRRH